MKRTILLATLITLTSILFSLQTLYVNINATPPGDGTFSSPCQQISTAITYSNPNDNVRIIVYPGNYNSITINNRTHSMTIESRFYEMGSISFINSTMIHGTYGELINDSACKITDCSNTQASITLRGFTLKDGGGTFTQVSGHNEQRGGGVYCSNAENVIVDNCYIKSNKSLYGGGIGIWGGSTNISNCKIYDNSVIEYFPFPRDPLGGGISVNGGTHNILNCDIYDNTAYQGGGLALIRGSATISDCKIYSNSVIEYPHIQGYTLGAGLLVNDGFFNILNSKIYGNTSLETSSGIIDIIPNIYYGSDYLQMSIMNCLIYENSSPSNTIRTITQHAFQGNEYMAFDMEGSSVTNNHITGENPSAVFFDHGSDGICGYATIKNSIIYGNLDCNSTNIANQVTGHGFIYHNYQYSDIGGTMFADQIVQVINLDPQFKNITNSDYSLAWETARKSPCIDTGDPTIIDPDNTCSDMGALPITQESYDYLFYGTNVVHGGWTWLCYPVLDVYNTNPQIGNVMNHLSLTGVLDHETWSLDGQQTSFILQNSQWINSNHPIASPEGYKAQIVTGDNYTDLSITAPRCPPETAFPLLGNCIENWVGYFLKESQSPEDALHSIWANVYSIETQNWAMVRIKNGWMITGGKRVFNDGDMAIIKCYNAIGSFTWNRLMPAQPIQRKMAEYFTYEEKADYLPVFIDNGEDIGLKEIAIYADGICKGAAVVEDTLTEVNAYVLDLPENTELEIVKYYEAKAPLQHITSAFVYDPDTAIISQSQIKLHKRDDYMYIGTEQSHMTPTAEVLLKMTCYPNPFNPSTVLEYSVTKASSSSLQIYNLKGQLVKTIWNGWQTEGSYKMRWDGTNENGKAVSSGIYFAKLKTSDHQITKKLMLLK